MERKTDVDVDKAIDSYLMLINTPESPNCKLHIYKVPLGFHVVLRAMY